MRCEDNSKQFTRKDWWLSMLFISTQFFYTIPDFLSDLSFPMAFLFLEFQNLFVFIIASLPTYWFFLFISGFLFKKPISDKMLRVELLIWIVPIFTINLLAINWIYLDMKSYWNLISNFTFFYICLFCFMLTFKLEREKGFAKATSMDDILDDDFHFKK
jgi:hypothetical protein